MKQHFEVLDGLRGTAALLVVILHILDGQFHYPNNPLQHASLAVDFFFMLSGFVIAYAYDNRWSTLAIGDFLRARLIRLHPLVFLTVILGALGYWFDPFVGMAQHVSGLRISASIVFEALLLPFKTLPNRWGATHSLNGPSWSLLQEYLANLAYALIGPRLGRVGLAAAVILAALALVITAITHGNLQDGWSWSTLWMAPIRVGFSFTVGMLIYRSGFRLHLPLPGTYAILSLVLLLLFMAPSYQPASYYEVLCVVVVFPLILATGAGAHSAGKFGRFCRFSGKISYPLYLVHYPFVSVFNHWLDSEHLTRGWTVVVVGILLVFLIGLAWVTLRLYDEPIRAWLSTHLGRKQLVIPVRIR